MKKVFFAMALMVTTSLHAQILNVNNNDGTYLPLNTQNIKEITFNESKKIVTLATGNGAEHFFYTDKVESLSAQTNKTTELKYNLSPTVAFNSNDKKNFNEITETIPNNKEEDENYGDYVENFSITYYVNIVFSENDVTVSGYDIDYTKNGAHLTINSNLGKVGYTVSGKSSNGSLKIYSEKKFQIMLSGLSLTNPSGPAINIQTGKTVYFTIDDNTINFTCDKALNCCCTVIKLNNIFLAVIV